MAVSHVFSNPVADGTVTSIVRPRDWNSAHNQYLSATGNTAGQSTFSGTNIVFGGGPNITLSGVNATRIDISAAAAGAGGSLNISAGTTSNNLTAVTFADGSGVSWGINASTVTATVRTNYASSSHSHAASGSNGSFAFDTLSFSNANGISFGTSAGPAITASYTVPTQSNQTGGIYVTAQSTGQSSSSTYDVRTLSFVPDGIISAGWSNGSFRVSATQSNQNVTAGNGGFAFQTLSFSNVNGVSFGTSAGSAITASYTRNAASNAIQSVGSATGSGTNTSRFAADDHVHAGVFSVGVSNIGNTSGDTRVDVGRFVFAGGNNITLSQGTAANALNTITISAPNQTNQTLSFAATSNTTADTSGMSVDARSITFQGMGIASVGFSTSAGGSSIIISVPAGGGAGDGGVFAGVSNLGNTAGSTGTVSTGNFVLVGSNMISLSQSTAAAGSHATVTINHTHETISNYSYQHPFNTVVTTANGTSHAQAFLLPEIGSFSFLRVPLSMSTNSTTVATTAATLSGSVELYSTWNYVVYSLGTGASSQSLISVLKGTNGFTWRNSISVLANGTQYTITQAYSHHALGAGVTSSTSYAISNTNYSYSAAFQSRFANVRFLDIPLTSSMTPGNYYLVFGVSTSSATNSTGVSAASQCYARVTSVGAHSGFNMANGFGEMGSTDMSRYGGILGFGSFFTAGGGTTSAIPITAISSVVSNIVPYFQLVGSA